MLLNLAALQPNGRGCGWLGDAIAEGGAAAASTRHACASGHASWRSGGNTGRAGGRGALRARVPRGGKNGRGGAPSHRDATPPVPSHRGRPHGLARPLRRRQPGWDAESGTGGWRGGGWRRERGVGAEPRLEASRRCQDGRPAALPRAGCAPHGRAARGRWRGHNAKPYSAWSCRLGGAEACKSGERAGRKPDVADVGGDGGAASGGAAARSSRRLVKARPMNYPVTGWAPRRRCRPPLRFPPLGCLRPPPPPPSGVRRRPTPPLVLASCTATYGPLGGRFCTASGGCTAAPPPPPAGVAVHLKGRLARRALPLVPLRPQRPAARQRGGGNTRGQR